MGRISSGKPWGEFVFCCLAPREAPYEVDVIKTQKKKGKQVDEVNSLTTGSSPTDSGTLKACGPVATCGTAQCVAAPVPYPEPAEAVTNPDTSLILNMLDPENGPASGLPYQVHYLGPPRPPCESERLATVKALGKFGPDKKPDPEINTILKLVQTIFNAPAALCALFDEKQVFISEQEGGVIPAGEFPWRWTLCGWSMAFKNPQILVIPDTLEDARFSNNEKATIFPKVRFYCGAPLIASNGHRLGTLCFADVRPRKIDAAACVMVNNLSELVVRQLEKDIALKQAQKNNQELEHTYKNLQRTVDCFDHCVVLLDTEAPGWRIVYTNAAWSKQTGLPRDNLVGRTLSDVLEGADGTMLPSPSHSKEAGAQRPFDVALARVRDPSVTKTFTLRFRAAGRQAVDDGAMAIGVPSWMPATGGEDKAQRFYFMVLEPPSATAKRSSVTSSAWGGPASAAFNILTTANGSTTSDVTTSSTASIDGLDLAHLLGRGSFGWVYYGNWFGTPVAVKVIDADARNVLCQATGVHREALVAHELRHPNIVATLKYAVRSVPYTRMDVPGRNSLDRDLYSNSSNTQPSGKGTDAGKSVLSTETGHTGSANAGWAVIEAPAGQGEGEDEEHMSEESAMVKKACQVKADAWALDTSGQNATNTPRSKNPNAPASLLDSSDANTSSTSVFAKQTWIVMEYCDRGCVQDAVDRGWLRDKRDCLTSHANMDAVLATCLEIASALCYLHAHDIVHGDLTGWNVMLTSSGASMTDGGRGWIVKVADFGLSRSLMQQQKIMTRTYGTITHMPPETLSEGAISKAMDVYSFGVLMWQMYTGSRPWSGLTHAQIIMRVCTQKMRLQWEAGAPPAYRKLAEQCMDHNPDNRPSFDAVIQRLEEMKGDGAQDV
mmetsp:Transcript_31353/g.79990  ORF Transcript_31353/g.79990 Transcript_31353/m.79990 type:complete len:891 (-) Transcript_31353:88-2760(-)